MSKKTAFKNPWHWWIRKIFIFEHWLYCAAKLKEHERLPWWGVVVRCMLHPSVWIGKIFGLAYRDISYDLVYIMGHPVTGQFLLMTINPFAENTLGYKKNDRWTFWSANPGEWYRVGGEFGIEAKHFMEAKDIFEGIGPYLQQELMRLALDEVIKSMEDERQRRKHIGKP